MPIHVPGPRDARGRTKKPKKRKAVAVLQLTAMVDMFTVIVVFLLQNYATTGEVIELPDSVALPQAQTVKELKPANVVVISKEGVKVNTKSVATFEQVQNQEDWMLTSVREEIERLIQAGEEKKSTLGNQIREAVTEASEGGQEAEEQIDEFRKITIQADKEIDFLSVKKVMYTVTEAGVYEINFAVLKKPELPSSTETIEN